MTGVYVAIIVKSDRCHYIDMGESQMVTTAKEQFSGQASPELLASIREIARAEGRDFETALEDAIRLYVECSAEERTHQEAMAHYRASVEKNRRLAELLAQ